jgi:hypothetical protein
MDFKSVVNRYNVKQCSLTKLGNCNDVDEPRGHDISEISQKQRDK